LGILRILFPLQVEKKETVEKPPLQPTLESSIPGLGLGGLIDLLSGYLVRIELAGFKAVIQLGNILRGVFVMGFVDDLEFRVSEIRNYSQNFGQMIHRGKRILIRAAKIQWDCENGANIASFSATQDSILPNGTKIPLSLCGIRHHSSYSKKATPTPRKLL
jgi:hypothetical protein